MGTALDMSLDDIIKSKKTVGRPRGRAGLPPGGGARGSFRGERVRDTGRGPGWKGLLGLNARPSSFTIAKSSRRTNKFPWQHDLFEESLAAAGLPGIESGSKLYISNLDRGVSNNDIRELFAEIGELKRYAIHFDKNGWPSGTAEVVYARRSDAFAAHKRYNDVQLDGRPMKIKIVSPNSEATVSARVNFVGGANGKSSRRVVLMQNTGRTISLAPKSCCQQEEKGGNEENEEWVGTTNKESESGARTAARKRTGPRKEAAGGEIGGGTGQGTLNNYHAQDMQTLAMFGKNSCLSS